MNYTRTGGRTWTRELGVAGATGATSAFGIAAGFGDEFVVGGTSGNLNGEINQGGNDPVRDPLRRHRHGPLIAVRGIAVRSLTPAILPTGAPPLLAR